MHPRRPYRLATAVVVLALVACRGNAEPRAADGARPARGVDALPCETVERENGPCILWGPSLIQLIARPELYDGKRVRVIGFLNLEFEGNGLYVSAEDWRQSIFRNGLWIEAPTGFQADSGGRGPRFNRRYAIVEATFRAVPRGHMGMWSGTLEAVTRLDAWDVRPQRPR